MIKATKRQKSNNRPKRTRARMQQPKAHNDSVSNQQERSLTHNLDTSVKSKNSTPIKYLTDLNVARFMAKLHGKNLRYVHAAGKWLVWDDKRWSEDNTGEIVRKAKDTALVVQEIVKTIQDDDLRLRLLKRSLTHQSEPRLKAMITLAESEPPIPITTDKLDPNPWLLNVQNGTINLSTGDLKPHNRKDHITKLIDVPYHLDASCPTWDTFIGRIMNDDSELIRFVQKIVGYSLTGSTKEQVMFVFYGGGANGKSTFITTLLTLLGDYSLQTPMETLLSKKDNAMSNDLARLKGARFVAAVESEHGKPLAEAQVKQLTGGDVITARFLYMEYFQYVPDFKLFVAVNHKPVIQGTDHGIWRRICVVPFTVTIPPEEQDKNLGEKLKAELPGILRWAVEGALLWQKEGLDTPNAVRRATREYRSEMDVLSDFIDEYCDVSDPGATISFQDLYYRYQDWCIADHEEPMSRREFSRRLDERGFTKGRNHALGRFRSGIRLKA